MKASSKQPTAPKAVYRVHNWNAYNAALKQRGSRTFWLDEAVLAIWINGGKTGRRGLSNHLVMER